ncbi:cation-efflux pump [Candidatus Photodesmus katoptron]|uniref:Cation-efflux pump FieF n=2 Tax=Candidatus Photodesmus anomalopis TaxID=28176 RepID=S3DZQ2_9GAMM|nr:Cation efflux protein [Candidatus Photodesmus katoptron Akat1]KEY90158.1 cation-efflux pump [Candidatus Photodesmus katoptron]
MVSIFLLIIKMIIWWSTGSVSLLASLIDSLFDIIISIINIIVVRYSLQPADKEHAFGHGKAESLSALAQAMFISGSSFFLILNGVERYFHPYKLHSPEYGIYVSLVAIVITYALVSFQKYVLEKTNSQAIAADFLHYKADLYMNVAVILALGFSYYGIEEADSIFAIGIGFCILYSAFKMLVGAINNLLDHKLPDDEIEKILSTCLSTKGVLGVHDLRTRMSGPVRFIQFHLELQDQIPLLEAHNISDKVEAKLLKLFPEADIMIHQDPRSIISKKEKKRPGRTI